MSKLDAHADGDARPGAMLVRLELPDLPGSLATVTEILAAWNVDIARLEVLERANGTATDVLLVEGGDVEQALRQLRGVVAVLECEPHAELRDPAITMSEACQRIAETRTISEARRETLRAAIDLAHATEGVMLRDAGRGWLLPISATVDGLPPIREGEPALAREVRISGATVTCPPGQAWAPLAYRERLGRGAAVLVPLPASDSLVAVVRSGSAPFTDAEARRVEGMVGVTGSVLRALNGQRSASLRQPEEHPSHF